MFETGEGLVYLATKIFPCISIAKKHRATNCDIDETELQAVASEILKLGLKTVCWYHSHPHYMPHPSKIDLLNMISAQYLTAGAEWLGLIISPYPPEKEVGAKLQAFKIN